MNYYYIVCGKTNPKRVLIDENKNIIKNTTTHNKEWETLTQKYNGTKGLFKHLLKKLHNRRSRKSILHTDGCFVSKVSSEEINILF